MKPSRHDDDDREEIRKCLTAYYTFYAPHRLAQLEDAVFAFTGRYEEMRAMLEDKYGAYPQTDLGPAITLLPSVPPSQREVVSLEDARRRLVSLFLEYAPLEVVNVDALLLSYSGRLHEAIRYVVNRLGPEPDMAARRERLVRFYEYYQPEKIKHVDDILFAYAGDVKALFAGLVDKYGPEPEPTDTSPHDTTKRRLIAFFAKYAPSRVAAVDDLLLIAGPRHQELFQALQLKYGPEPNAVVRPRNAVARQLLFQTQVNSPTGAPTTSSQTAAGVGGHDAPGGRLDEDALLFDSSDEGDDVFRLDKNDDDERSSTRGGEEATDNFAYREFLSRAGVKMSKDLEHEVGSDFAAVVTLVAWCRRTSSLIDMTIDDIQLPKRPTLIDRAAFQYLVRIEAVGDEDSERQVLQTAAFEQRRELYGELRRRVVVLAVTEALTFTEAAEPKLRREIEAEEALDSEMLVRMKQHHLTWLYTRHDPARVEVLWEAFVHAIEASGSTLPGMARPTNKHPELYHKVNHTHVVAKENSLRRARSPIAATVAPGRRSLRDATRGSSEARQPSEVPAFATPQPGACRSDFCREDLGSDDSRSSSDRHSHPREVEEEERAKVSPGRSPQSTRQGRSTPLTSPPSSSSPSAARKTRESASTRRLTGGGGGGKSSPPGGVAVSLLDRRGTVTVCPKGAFSNAVLPPPRRRLAM